VVWESTVSSPSGVQVEDWVRSESTQTMGFPRDQRMSFPAELYTVIFIT